MTINQDMEQVDGFGVRESKSEIVYLLPGAAFRAEVVAGHDEFFGGQHTFLQELAVLQGTLQTGSDAGCCLVYTVFSLLYSLH